MGDSVFLHFRRLQHILMTAHRLIRLRHNSHYIVAAFHQTAEGTHRKLRGTHKYDA